MIPAGTGFRSYTQMKVQRLGEPLAAESDLNEVIRTEAEARGATAPPVVEVPVEETEELVAADGAALLMESETGMEELSTSGPRGTDDSPPQPLDSGPSSDQGSELDTPIS